MHNKFEKRGIKKFTTIIMNRKRKRRVLINIRSKKYSK